MSEYSIGQLAQRSGFSASTLRYYDSIGLVEPADRTEAGYRIYDDDALTRLSFVARAKRLGCSLEAITDLVAIRDGEHCQPVQSRFHELVTEQLESARRQLTELTAFIDDLEAAARHLSSEPVDGPCGDACACWSDPPRAGATSVEAPFPVRISVPVSIGSTTPMVPLTCTVARSDVPVRLADWQSVLSGARSRTVTIYGALRIELGGDVALDRLIDLVTAEQQCCAALTFTLTFDTEGIAMEVRTDDNDTEGLLSLLGERA